MTLVAEASPLAGLVPRDEQLDQTVRPQDDFYRFVNGRWADGFTLSEHRAEVSLLSMLAEKVHGDVAALIRAAAAGPPEPGDVSARQIADLYTSFMDEECIERRGVTVFHADLHAVRSAADRAGLARSLGRLQAQGIGGIVKFSVTTDTENASRYLLNLSPDGLGLPRPAHYLDPTHAPLRGRYAGHLVGLLSRVGITDAGVVADTVLRLETELAAGHVAPDAQGRSAATTRCTVADLAGRTGGFPWTSWLHGLGTVPASATVSMRRSAFLETVDRWWLGHSLDELKRWVMWRYVHEMAPFGPSAVFAENFEFFGKVMIGATQIRPRWMRAVSLVETILGDAVGERYLAGHLCPSTVRAVTELVGALVRAYRDRLGSAAWMRETTRASALSKLDRMVFEIGSPRTLETRADLLVDPEDMFGNVKRGREWYVARELARLGAPVDRSAWRIHPQQVTAYYRHGFNHVVIPAALLQPPVFEPGGDPARNFAVLGSIICHEMSHAFDDRGSRYDDQGRMLDWWAPQDWAEFTRRTSRLVEQYDQFEPVDLPGHRVSGTRTVSENIADIAGLTVAQAAFADHVAAGGHVEPAHLRRFFMHWASMWRAKRTPARLRRWLTSDRHAPAEFRCNGILPHVPAFYEAFDVREGDLLYVPPQARFSLL